MLPDLASTPLPTVPTHGREPAAPLWSGVLLVAMFCLGGLAVMQNDSWWHLRCGQLIWQLGWVPDRDPFSFALGAEAHWPNHEWLAQAILFAIWSIGGLPLVNLGIGALVALTGWLLLAALDGPVQRRVVLVWLLLPCLAAALSVRPQVWTLLAMAATVLLLVRGRLAYLPPIFLAWANLHGGVVLGGLVLVGACLAALLFDRRRLPALLATTTACGLATLCTPMGLGILTFPLESVARLKQLELVEWSAPGLTSPLHLYFWCLLIAFAALLIHQRLRNPARLAAWPTNMLTLTAGLLGILAIMSERNAAPFAIVAFAAASRLIGAPAPARRSADRPASRSDDLPAGQCDDRPTSHSDALPVSCGPDSQTDRPPHPADRRVVAGVAVAGLAVLAWAHCRPWSGLQWEPMSREAIAAVRACAQPTFNTYNTGGYLLWFTPEREVFIDSRQDPYPLELLQCAIHAQHSGQYAGLFERFGFRSAVMERRLPLERALRADGWRERYRDASWVVLEAPRPDAALAAAKRAAGNMHGELP